MNKNSFHIKNRRRELSPENIVIKKTSGVKKRLCLRCDKKFNSDGKNNRVCYACNKWISTSMDQYD